MPQKYIVAGETVCIICKINTECVSKAVVSKEFFDMFNAFDTIEKKLNAMNMFLNLPANVQESFKVQLCGETFATAKNSPAPSTDTETLRLKFDMCRNTYSPQQQRDIEAMFEECRNLTYANKTRAARRLSYILNINQGVSQDISMTKEEIIAKLDSLLHKHNKLKEKLAEAIVASKYSNKKGFCILLVGSPGVGKTAIMKAVAEVLGIPFFVIPLGSSTSLVDVLGDAPHYDASDCGEVVKNYYKVGTTRVVFGLDDRQLIIGTDDIKSVLGNPPAERGNFPCENYPGLSKALAVTGNNCGMAFSVETMLIPDENSLTITGLPKESTVDSVKLAISYIKCHYKGILSNKGIHIHFGEGALQKDGPSAGVAILMSLLSAVFNIPIVENVSYTGEINANGYVFNIGGTIAKIQAAEQSGCSKVFIPEGNYKELSKDDLDMFSIEVIPINHVSQVIENIFTEHHRKIA